MNSTDHGLVRDTAPAFERAPGARDLSARRYGLAVAYRAGEAIYRDGDDIRYFFQVRSGVVRCCTYWDEGRRHIDAFHLRGDVFGFDDLGQRRASAECVSDTVLVAYRRPPVYALSQIDAASSRYLLAQGMIALAKAQAHAAALSCHRAEARIAFLLLEIAARMDNDQVVELPLPRLDIADYLGLRVESVSRTFKKLKHAGLIAMPSPRLVLLKNMWALQALSP
jgi:CRP/FNR family nitrogen fixation transcriptional regulator